MVGSFFSPFKVLLRKIVRAFRVEVSSLGTESDDTALDGKDRVESAERTIY